MISATSPNQEGVEGTDSEEVWMITEESAILVISTSLLGTMLFFLIKEAYFYARSLLVPSRCAIRGSWEKRPWDSSAGQGFAGQSWASSLRTYLTACPRLGASRRLVCWTPGKGRCEPVVWSRIGTALCVRT